MTPKVAALLLWCLLGCAVVLVAAMTIHPWVIGNTAGCAAHEARAWDGRCYSRKRTP